MLLFCGDAGDVFRQNKHGMKGIREKFSAERSNPSLNFTTLHFSWKHRMIEIGVSMTAIINYHPFFCTSCAPYLTFAFRAPRVGVSIRSFPRQNFVARPFVVDLRAQQLSRRLLRRLSRGCLIFSSLLPFFISVPTTS